MRNARTTDASPHGAAGVAAAQDARNRSGSGAPDDGFWVAERAEDEVARLIAIAGVESDGGRAVFRGQPLADSAATYASVENTLHGRGLDVWLVEPQAGRAAVIVSPRTERVPMVQRPMWNILLLLATLATATWAGAAHHGIDIVKQPAQWAVGLPYALALLLILGIHEMGHYVIARRRGVQVTLPYFIPAPFFLGTFGAFIRMGGPVRDRRTYFDVAVAGPLAGLVAAVLAIWLGLAMTPGIAGHGMVPGSSLLFAALYKLAGGGSLSQAIELGPVGFAGWLGLLVTALNLAPIGQLDGGHIAYALFGRNRARKIGLAVVGLMVAVGLFYSAHFLMWAVVVYFLAGVEHPIANNELADIGLARRILGYGALAILAAILLPVPGL